ncbi:hypothetical protein ACFOWE_30810 [Planomonospora corallina]|uniref:Uncharacterized protein n=1 Tax=Planomonospora corallina TaxID=1806052 RepID=A0ABV8IHN4_9ACTN
MEDMPDIATREVTSPTADTRSRLVMIFFWTLRSANHAVTETRRLRGELSADPARRSVIDDMKRIS